MEEMFCLEPKGILLTLLFMFVLYVVFVKLQNRRSTNLIDKIPGPKTLPFLGNILQLGTLTSKPSCVNPNAVRFQHLQGISWLYSEHKIYRIWLGSFPMVIFHKPESIEVLLSSHVLIDKSRTYDFVLPWLGRGLLTSTGSKWKKRRRQLTPAFHFRILQDFQHVMNQNANILVEKMQKQCGQECVDIVPLLTMCTLDIICETAMGVSINAQEHSTTPYVIALKEVTRIVVERAARPWLWSEFVFRLSPRGRRFYKSLAIMHNFTRKIIRERKKEMIENSGTKGASNAEDETGTKRRVAFLELLLELHLSDSSQISEEEIREEVDTFMFEGHDTTTYGLSWAIYLIGLHPKVQRKIHQELDTIFGDDKSRPTTREDLLEMKYLECVLKESLRILPSVPSVSRRVSEDVVIDGYTVPKGTSCHIFKYQLHRNPEIFPEPELFDPDRFLPENSSTRHPYAYVPFSAGPRNCIGQRFAMNEEKTLAAAILRNFEISSMDPRDKIHLLSELILKPVSGIRLHLKSK